MKNRKVIWGKRAIVEFNKAIKYIRKHSEQNADKVREKMLDKINALADKSVVPRKDSYKNNNDGNYLYFELMSHRVVYYATQEEVLL